MDQKKQQARKADGLTRRDLMRTGAVAAAGLAVGPAQKARARTRSYNPQMKYRLLGRTGLWISSVCLGGHWKRIDKMVTDETGLWATMKKSGIGWFGIKPFASNSLFKGDSSPDSPTRQEDDRLARMAIRYILCNPSITAPIPGMINAHQVNNVANAIMEPEELAKEEAKELELAMDDAWDRLPANYQWLKNWEYV